MGLSIVRAFAAGACWRLGLALAVFTIVNSNSAEATCGDYLQHPAEHNLADRDDTNAASPALPSQSKCSGGACRQMPASGSGQSVELTLRPDSGVKSLLKQLQQFDQDVDDRGFSAPLDERVQGLQLAQRLERPPQSISRTP